MLGKIALEEAFEMPDMQAKSRREAELFIHPQHQERYVSRIGDITGERLELSDKYGIGYTICSLTVPGIQGISNAAQAEARATEVNNWIHSQVKQHPDRLGAFACLSMHDPVQAGQELTRCVKELGFHGGLVCDFQHAGVDGEDYLFYDQPRYDAFWKVLTDLDVPLYLHPAAPSGVIHEKLYAQRRYLVGPPLSFANGVNLHTLGLITNGVFDRFPKAKLIVGHLGEHVPFDFWRIEHWIRDVERPLANGRGDVMCKHSIYHYFKTNIWLTTSGHYSTASLKFVIGELGPDRVLFSVDYPYELIEDASNWWDGHAKEVIDACGGKEAYLKVGRENAKALFGLPEYHDWDAPLDV